MTYIYLPDNAAVMFLLVKEYENSKVTLKMHKKISLPIFNT